MARLQKVLAQAGIASRRKCEELIVSGRVSVNGQMVTDLGVKVDPRADRIEVDHQVVGQSRMVYFLFHKPVGVITSVTDPQGRRVVLDYFTEITERIYPVGRLDLDTSGLLLLTNDGELTHPLLHPSFMIDKVYLATVQGVPSSRHLERLSRGVNLQDGPTAPAEVELVSINAGGDRSVIRLTIHEGRKRQVRRMCKYIGHPVIQLHREQYGFLTLHGLAEGTYRALTAEEVRNLKKLIIEIREGRDEK